MKPAFLAVMHLLLCGSSVVRTADAPAVTAEAGSKAETGKQPGWAFTPNPSLPNVLILGDSISIGYTLEVRELLKGKANVFRPISPDGTKPVNCDGTTSGVRLIDAWLAGVKWSVIHFNWGLHDLKHVTEAGTAKNSNLATDPPQATVEVCSRNLMDGPCTLPVRDIHSTILHLMGPDHERLTYRHAGLDVRLTGVEHAQVVKGVRA